MPRAINDLGQIAGYYTDASGRSHGFLLDGSQFTSFDYPGATNTSAYGINDAGQIVGRSDFTYNSFLKEGSIFRTLSYPGANYTVVSGINDAGQIIGYASFAGAFVTDGSNFVPFAYPGAVSTIPAGINNQGQIVGYLFTCLDAPCSTPSFLKDGTNFTLFDYPVSTRSGLTTTLAQDINDSGRIVGSYVSPEQVSRGFIKEGANFTTIDFPGARSTIPYGINNRGQIVGSYSLSPIGADEIGFVATPVAVPEPYTLTLAGIGLLLFCWRRRAIDSRLFASIRGRQKHAPAARGVIQHG